VQGDLGTMPGNTQGASSPISSGNLESKSKAYLVSAIAKRGVSVGTRLVQHGILLV